MDINLNMELYRVFYAVATCKNISKAAEILYISQPAISKSIKKLEDTLEVSLFVRNSRGVRLTREGSAFFNHVQNAMTELSLGKNVLEKMKTNEYGIVKMSISTTLCKHLLLPHLKTYMLLNPHIKIQILNRSATETLQLIDEGSIDFGLVSQHTTMENYNFLKLTNIHDVFVACNQYIETSYLDANSIFSPLHTIMLMEEDNVSRKYIDRYMLINNISVKPEIETGNMDILIEFAKLGLGITVVIKEFIQNELKTGNLVELPITPAIPARSAGIVYHKNLPLSLAAHAFINHLQSSFK